VDDLELQSWELRVGEVIPDLILDLRPAEQFERVRIRGAVSMPYNRFQAESEVRVAGLGRILLVDGAGARAAEMAVWLRVRGHNVCYLSGGMAAWTGLLEAR
jgi:rhodanese-related sulfurtransferase